MLRRAKKHQKNLARLVLAALLCTGAADGIISPSVAEAAGSITVTGYSSGQFIPDGSMVTVYDSGYYTAYPADGSVTTLNLVPGETDTWTGGNTVSVYGHYVKGASGDTPMDASGYTVKMTGAKAQVNYLTGGYAENSVTIDASGGTNDTGNVTAAANENTVTISEAAIVYGDVYGGDAYADAYAVYGAVNTASATATANDNTVTITGAAVNTDVYGGTAYGYAYAYEGTTNTSKTTVEASNNTITIGKDANVGDAIYGGFIDTDIEAYAYVESASGITATAKGTASTNDNTITISDNAVVGEDVYGGSNYTYIYAYGYDAGTATAEGTVDANNNTITISGTAKVGEDVYGGYNYTYIYAYGYDAGTATAEGTVNANNNTITISDDAKVQDTIYGGYNTTYVEPHAYNAGIGTVEESTNANNNTITISDNAVVGDVYGGYNYTYTYAYVSLGTATAEETSGSATAEETSNANNNTITISDNAKAGSVYGGLNYFYVYYTYAYGGDATVTGTANANKNTITISGTAEVGEVYGGYNTAYAESVYAYDSGDKVTVEITASASENTVAISDKAVVSNDVYGGNNKSYAYYDIYTYYGEIAVDLTGSANKNTVTISGDTSVAGSVYGGYNDSYAYYIYAYYSGSSVTAGITSDASENEVTISGATVTGTVYGGYNTNEIYAYAYEAGSKSTVELTANANNNTITISGNAEVGAVYGGYTEATTYSSDYYAESTNTVVATASGNEVTVSGASVSSDVYGGDITSYAYYGNTASADLAASTNTVTISDATVGGNVYGGAISGEAYAYDYASAVHTATGTGAANENEVTISDTTVGGNVYGGNAGIEAYGHTYDTNYNVEGNATAGAGSNTVSIDSAATVGGNVYGGYAYADSYAYYGAVNTASATADASNNTVSISEGASVSGDVYAGYAYAEATAADGATNIAEATASASSNTITISGATVTGTVYGGYTYAAISDGGTATAAANKNTVNLLDATISGSVYGGDTANSDGADVVTGNTLVISGVNTAGGKVTNFETIKLADTVKWNPDAPVLKATQFAKNADADGTRAALDVTDVKADIAPGKGGQMTLLASDAENDFATLGLIYSGGTATLDESTQSQVVKDEEISEERKGVAVISQSVHTVSLDGENSYKNVLYSVENETKGVSIKEIKWQKDAELFDGSTYDYKNVTKIDTSVFDVTYEDGVPQTVAKGDSMTLLKANETLTAIVNEEKSKAYSFTPVSGVTVDAAVTGKLANSGNNVVFTATENKAGKLTFGDVEWKTSGALMKRPSNITFAGADVDTSKINFTNMTYLDANQQMTLVSDFGDKVGTITGSKYLVGTAFEGEGAASLSGKELIFRTKTGTGVSEQTHKTVMATEAGVTALTIGNDYIGKALDGMGDVANVAPDGSTVGAAIGGGKNRYETGSHVNVNSWNAAVAVGAKREMKNGSLEYGVFGEYGKANFTLHSDAGRGDGDARYAGGGLVAKWTNKHDVYTEASFRLGRLSESSSDIMRDGLGNTYGYDVHANYYGAHVGVGKIFRYNGGRSLDVYGKYFYTKRNGVEFDAVQHYNLDSVASSVLRIGARYGTTDKKWNWYGGLAYEYEFDGEAKGVVNGVAIRAASIKGSSVRGEIGLRMNATKTNPWQTDISIYGYGGKHRGFGGSVNVAYTF